MGRPEATTTPPLQDQIAAVERYLERKLPDALCNLYATGVAQTLGLLPLTTGREHGPSLAVGSDADRFLDAQVRLDSVLGNAMGHRELSQHDDDYVWPARLLVLEDVGCAIYRAVDLDDPSLRVIQYESLEPTDDADEIVDDARCPFREPLVPRALQHRFTIVADSLEEWVGQATNRHA